jgi:F0F1-type ATP synthase delta subunit
MPQSSRITLYLKSSLGTDYELVKLIDPSLVAGFTLQVNDTFIDASILGKINLVQNTLTTKE